MFGVSGRPRGIGFINFHYLVPWDLLTLSGTPVGEWPGASTGHDTINTIHFPIVPYRPSGEPVPANQRYLSGFFFERPGNNGEAHLERISIQLGINTATFPDDDGREDVRYGIDLVYPDL